MLNDSTGSLYLLISHLYKFLFYWHWIRINSQRVFFMFSLPIVTPSYNITFRFEWTSSQIHSTPIHYSFRIGVVYFNITIDWTNLPQRIAYQPFCHTFIPFSLTGPTEPADHYQPSVLPQRCISHFTSSASLVFYSV